MTSINTHAHLISKLYLLTIFCARYIFLPVRSLVASLFSLQVTIFGVFGFSFEKCPVVTISGLGTLYGVLL